jgi:cellulose synthase/poly-beta-1,6-N-acetylglucosamine synthase-like glycosyltransferase
VTDFLSLIWLVIFILGALYVGQILAFIRGLSRLHFAAGNRLYSVAVIVAARNEELHLEKCIRSLLAQDYPHDKYTITVVDDQSTDRTADIVRQLARENPAVQLMQLHGHPPGISPIVHAMNEAIKATSSEIILRTDADCLVGPHWMSSMVRHFDETVGIITGVTLIAEKQNISSLFFGFQRIDLFSQTAIAAGAIGMNAPINCNGSNMGFRRAAFNEVGGFGSIGTINSGSDSLLAQKIAATPHWKMRFACWPETHVTTLPVTSWRQLLQQRMRWAGHTPHYRTSTVVFLVASFLLYLLVFLFAPISIFYFPMVTLPIAVLFIKFVVDYWIIFKFSKLTNVAGMMKYFFVAEVIHFPLILTAVFGSFFGSFEWKGRRMKREISQHA